MAEDITTEPEKDYEELYKQALANSRKWEARAKENKDAAAKLAEYEQSKKSADEKVAKLTDRLDAMEKEKAHAALAAKVSKEKGVPAELLVGETEEDMGAWADKMTAHFKTPAAPKVEKSGSFSTASAADDKTELREFARQLLPK